MFLATWLALLPSIAHAGSASICTPVAELHGAIDFCDDNPEYIKHAQACADAYKALVESRYPVIRKLLMGQVKGAKDEAQNLKFGTTEDVYASTDAELTNLINKGKQVLSELDGYGNDLVPPIPSYAVGYFKPNWRNPADPGRTEEDLYCYGEPAADLEVIYNATQKVVDELTATKNQTVQLHGVTTGRDGSLVNLTGLAGKAGPDGPRGTAFNPVSDVTGLKQDRAKRKSLSDAKASPHKLAKPDLEPAIPAASKAPAPSSDVTGIKGAESEGKSNDGKSFGNLSSIFSGNIPQKQTNAQVGKNGAAGSPSVGEAIWAAPVQGAEASDNAVAVASLKLSSASGQGVNQGVNQGAREDSGSWSEGAPSTAGAGSSQPAESMRLPSSALQASLAAAGANMTIFDLVHRRYRSTEIFRSRR